MALATIETSSMRPPLAIAPHSLAMSGSRLQHAGFALREGDEQIGQGDVGPEPRHQAVLAVAAGSAAALAVNAQESIQRELAERMGADPPHPCWFFDWYWRAIVRAWVGCGRSARALRASRRRELPARSAATHHRYAA